MRVHFANFSFFKTWIQAKSNIWISKCYTIPDGMVRVSRVKGLVTSLITWLAILSVTWLVASSLALMVTSLTMWLDTFSVILFVTSLVTWLVTSSMTHFIRHFASHNIDHLVGHFITWCVTSSLYVEAASIQWGVYHEHLTRTKSASYKPTKR